MHMMLQTIGFNLLQLRKQLKIMASLMSDSMVTVNRGATTFRSVASSF